MDFYIGFQHGFWFDLGLLLLGAFLGWLLHWWYERWFFRTTDTARYPKTAEIKEKEEYTSVSKLVETKSEKTEKNPNAWGYPQHLSDVRGIGTVFEDRLYNYGVGSYWELSEMSNNALEKALKIDRDEVRNVNFDEIKKDALRLARETKSVGRKWNGDVPDNFEPLSGIGRVYEKKLYEAGIYTYEKLASTTVSELESVVFENGKKTVNNVDVASWITQAKKLVK